MVTLPSPQSELSAICDLWAEQLQPLGDENARMDHIKSVLPELINNRRLWRRILQAVVSGASYPDLRQATMFKDELILYPNNKRLFSLRMYIYDSKAYTPVHDHNAWGVIGALLGQTEIIRYRREDDGSREDYARLNQNGRRTLSAGDTDVTRPLDEGIHQTGNPNGGTSIMLSVYGNPIRRLYINRFDLDRDRAYKMYPPRMQKKKLASQALDALVNSAM